MKTRLLRDREKLSLDYIPERIPHRRDELRGLIEVFREGLEGREARSIAVCIGSEGSGKTVTIEHLREWVEEEAEELGVSLLFKRVPCRVERCPSHIIGSLAASIDPLLPLKGLPLSEVLSSILESAEKKNERILFVLDDADLLLEDHPETIYLLTRIGEMIPEAEHTLFLLLTFKSMDVIQRAKPWITSPLMRNVIFFKDYTKSQLREILEYRVWEAFYPGSVSEKALDLAADMGPNARFSLELLLRAGEVAEDEGSLVVTPDHIRRAEGDVFPAFPQRDLLYLSLHEKLILMALASLLESSPTSLVGMGELEERYRMISQDHGVPPIRHTWLWRSVDTLAKLGFISKTLSGKGRKGRTTLVSLPGARPRPLLKRLRHILGSMG